MLARRDTVVVAVSGGADSMALMHGLAAVGPDLGFTLHVAHFDHQLRPESGADAAFVESEAGRLGLPFRAEAGDPRALVERDGLSLEDAGRRLRYAFLLRVAGAIAAEAVATGHTVDDQAETVLLRLLRGSGLDGLAGIPPVRSSGGVRIVRPLIETTHQETQAYLRRIGVPWREDATNRDTSIPRNRVRVVLLPSLEGYNPGVRRTLARVARLLRDEADALETLSASLIARALSGPAGQAHIERDSFARLLPALQRRAVREAVRRVRGNLRGLQFVHIEGVRHLVLDGVVGSWVPLPGGLLARRVAGGIDVVLKEGGAEEDRAVYRLRVPGRVVALEFGLQLLAEEVSASEQPKREVGAAGPDRPDELLIDAGSAGVELVLRGPRSGDRFAPEGMRGHTKMLSDFLRDERIPRHRRGRMPVLTTSEGRILWVVGRRAAHGVRPVREGAPAVRVVARRLRAASV